MQFLRVLSFIGLALVLSTPATADVPLVVNPGDKVVLIGNTFAERMTMFGHYEARLHARYPEHKLVFRNLGWSADEVALRPQLRALSVPASGHRPRRQSNARRVNGEACESPFSYLTVTDPQQLSFAEG